MFPYNFHHYFHYVVYSLLVLQVSARNVLLVIVDDMNSIELYKNLNIDKKLSAFNHFISESEVFNGITPIPVCGPARAALMTGLNPDTSKLLNFESYLPSNNMFAHFKNNGYRTFASGKVFHTLPVDIDKQYEYNQNYLTDERQCTDIGNSECPRNQIYCYSRLKTLVDQCIVKTTIDFLELMAKNKSIKWIAGIGFHRPHINMAVPLAYYDKFSGKFSVDFSVPTRNFSTSLSNFEHLDYGRIRVPIDNSWVRIVDNVSRFKLTDLFQSRYRTTINLIRNAYYKNILYTIDNFMLIYKNVMRLFPDDTDIIFISDNGFQIGERKQLGKNTLYPESVNIPFIFRTAGKIPSKTKKEVRRFASLIDIFPTLIDLHKLPKLNVDGKRLSEERDYVLSQYPRCMKIGNVQTSDCMTSNGSCKRDSILYMGYLLIHKNYRYMAWFQYKENRETCKWPVFKGIAFGRVPTFVIKQNSGPYGKPVEEELYTEDDPHTNIIVNGVVRQMMLSKLMNLIS